jgi:hypothetical protein
LLTVIADEKDERLAIDARASLIVLAAQLQALQTMIGAIERRIMVQHRANEASKRVATIPGIGVGGASAITATVANPDAFRSGRDFAAWIGLGCIQRPDTWLHPNVSRNRQIHLLHRGRRPYMALPLSKVERLYFLGFQIVSA